MVLNKMANLKCALCEKTVGAVKVLPCLHVMCETCVSGYFNQHSKVTSIIPCPSCGFKIQIPKCGDIPLTTYICRNALNNNGHIDIECHGEPGDNSSKHCVKHDEKSCDSNNKVELIEDGPLEKKDSDTAQINIETAAAQKELLIGERQECEHDERDETDAQDLSQNERDYLTELLKTMKLAMTKKGQQIEQLDVLMKQLITTRDAAEKELEKRAEYLCQLIQDRKTKLQNEINNICNVQLEKYRVRQEQSQKEADLFNDARMFTDDVLKTDDDAVMSELHNDISGRLLDLIHRYKSDVEIFTVKLDSPDRGKEELHLSKLFGQFMTGTINCGNADLVSSFNIDLSWPSSLILTKLNDFVVVGKTGAFETSGKVMFCDSHGHVKGTHDYKDDTVPFDAVSLQDGSILVSDNHGTITKFSLFGNVHGVWKDKFKGSGKMARTFRNDIVITSSEEQCVYKYNKNGELICRYPAVSEPTDFEHPHGIAIDSQDNMIIADYQQNCVVWLDPKGKLLRKYSGCPDIPLRCPSAVCCDAFDNVLVADFTNDAVHLVSSTGQFLGYLLTKDNDMSCPNFLTLDHDGHLFVGQYGGQIQVFRYLSYTRQA